MIGIIEYGSGNVAAIMNLLKQKKIDHFLSSNPTELRQADRFLLPGVGAFDPTIAHLTGSGILDTLRDEVHGKGKRILGICVGMHLLSQGSDEGQRDGLDWVPGRVRKIDASSLTTRPHLPHMGWNAVTLNGEEPLFSGIDAKRGFYFLHSYYFDVAAEGNVLARVNYGRDLPCAVRNGNVYGVQFHPEKSHSNGMRLIQNFAELS
ncbi:glutamine amidotransferase [Shimia gijangensis]|uniref:Imidazole glycerol phosphate synthase subunit HisH n=1 Tax=Shimia gijangensis TaxID=1470563 RepID=A0A1M6SDV0_9RHOB|nr:imidazole glycerol phosphate synthase subunit HisH [Shimia gijangensis]SHK42890.1 glutamine amidotransferase [Shimia gijangensis]